MVGLALCTLPESSTSHQVKKRSFLFFFPNMPLKIPLNHQTTAGYFLAWHVSPIPSRSTLLPTKQDPHLSNTTPQHRLISCLCSTPLLLLSTVWSAIPILFKTLIRKLVALLRTKDWFGIFTRDPNTCV